ncbi:MAG: methylenetetrahydrofolate reductase [NAD(P)H] [Myxococcota bacterium]
MFIKEKLAGGHPTFSFEFFPPKTEKGEQNLWAVLEELVDLRPSYVSVTYGAGGSTRAKTVDLTQRIQTELGIDAMAHLTCVGATKDQIAEVMDDLRERGVKNVLALRGDPPKGQDRFQRTEGGFGYADELVGFLRDRYGDAICIGAACYPEKHVECGSQYQDLSNLKRKVDAGVDFLVSQLFFDNRLFFDFVDRAHAAGINVPIIPGIMPIQNFDQIKRFTAMCGASIPADLLGELEKRAETPERVQDLGVVHATIQALGLIQGGAPGVHFYTLNKSSATRDIVSTIRVNARV